MFERPRCESITMTVRPARAAVVPRAVRHRVFRGCQAIAGGLLTADQLRGRAYMRMFRDVYLHLDAVDAEQPIEHRVRIEAAALLLPSGAVIRVRMAPLPAQDVVGSPPAGRSPRRSRACESCSLSPV